MVIVAGGGISGLSAAYYLTKKYAQSNLKLILLEATKRCGGWAKSTLNDDSLFEGGPRTIRPKGPLGVNTMNLIEEIGLTDKVISLKFDHPAATNRMIYANNQLNLLPSSLLGAMSTKPPFTKPLIRLFLNDLRSKPALNLNDDTIYNFMDRRFGRELADYAVSPMICGICAGDAKEISVKFLFKQLFELEQNHGGVIKGVFKNMFKKKENSDIESKELAKRAKNEKWSIYTLKGGMEELAIGLSSKLNQTGVKLLKEHKVSKISFYKDNKKVIVKVNNYAFSSEHLFCCIPAFELAPLLKNDHPILSQELEQIPFVDVVVINLQFKSYQLKQQAFGFLVPPIEKLPILGVTFDSCCIPDQKGTVITVMLGGKWFNEYFGENASEEYMLDIALKHVKKILNIDQKPDCIKVNILKKCIPQYIVGHHDRVSRIRKYIEEQKLPLSLCGASYDGVGVNDVIMSSRTAVQNSHLQ